MRARPALQRRSEPGSRAPCAEYRKTPLGMRAVDWVLFNNQRHRLTVCFRKRGSAYARGSFSDAHSYEHVGEAATRMRPYPRSVKRCLLVQAQRSRRRTSTDRAPRFLFKWTCYCQGGRPHLDPRSVERCPVPSSRSAATRCYRTAASHQCETRKVIDRSKPTVSFKLHPWSKAV